MLDWDEAGLPVERWHLTAALLSALGGSGMKSKYSTANGMIARHSSSLE